MPHSDIRAFIKLYIRPVLLENASSIAKEGRLEPLLGALELSSSEDRAQACNGLLILGSEIESLAECVWEDYKQGSGSNRKLKIYNQLRDLGKECRDKYRYFIEK